MTREELSAQIDVLQEVRAAIARERRTCNTHDAEALDARIDALNAEIYALIQQFNDMEIAAAFGEGGQDGHDD